MPDIIKRSGRKEPFSIDKVRESLSASSADASKPLTSGEMDRIIAEFRQIVDGKTIFTTQQVVTVMAGLLYTKGYGEVLDQYLGYRRE